MKKYLVTLAYELVVDADNEETAIDTARAGLSDARKITADFDLCWADEFDFP